MTRWVYRWLRDWLLLLAALSPAFAASDTDLAARLQQGGHVMVLRHAQAPGLGDPPQFELDDCATQRNLDAVGRTQARAVGAALRGHGINSARIYSSQWCRSLETARLLELGSVTPLPLLNSLFGRRAGEVASNANAFRDFLARQPENGPLIVLVTHHVNIRAYTGLSVGSAEAVLLQLHADAAPRVLGRLDLSASRDRATVPAP